MNPTMLGGSFFLLVAVLLWLWWSYARQRIPQNVAKKELERFEAEDKFRQTISQLFAGAALIATFALTVYQTFESQRQWAADNRGRQAQERDQRFTEALKELNTPSRLRCHDCLQLALHR
jgi:TRAP-type C4-dicarboxylate transport system permease small subunit